MTSKGETSKDTDDREERSATTELNNIDISVVADQLTSLALSDKGNDANSNTNDDEALSDLELMKPHPPNEDCPVCFVPLPFGGHTEFKCCDKLICRACTSEHIRAILVVNIKRKAKDLPELEKNCPFCRAPPRQRSDSELIENLKERVHKGDGAAAYNLARQYMEGGLGLDRDEGKAVEICHRAADMGSAPANLWLSHAYAFEEDLVELDFNKAKMYAERAVKLNCPEARELLALFAVQGKKNNSM